MKIKISALVESKSIMAVEEGDNKGKERPVASINGAADRSSTSTAPMFEGSWF